ncbi:MAG TPA: enolase C-terminal domain-like protein [Micromonosporaceae bacterium]
MDVTTAVFTVPLPDPETDGTLAWTATTMVTATVSADGCTGLGWTYGPAAIAGVITDVLAPVVTPLDPMDIPAAYLRMRQASRNAPTPGLASYAIAAIDVALWDLKARLLGISVPRLLGTADRKVPAYGSGGFTSLTDDQLRKQLEDWLGQGLTAVKMKIGEDRGGNKRRDLHRIAVARDVIGPDVALMVDANGGYQAKQALYVAEAAADADVSWFEEPVSSDQLDDLALLRGMIRPEVTAGEYGTTTEYFRRMCDAGAVDCLQVDASRCGGWTGLLAAAAVADTYGLQVSTHCGPHLHAPAAPAIPNSRHAEYFADHVHADRLLLDGLPPLENGSLRPDLAAAGHGMTLRPGADEFRVR